MAKDYVTYDEMTDMGVKLVLEAVEGTGTLRSAIATIVNQSAHWGAQNVERRKLEREIEEAKAQAAATIKHGRRS